jgi:adenine phosphoribosyltransferase
MNEGNDRGIRRQVIERFRWIDGHADVAGLFRDADLLRDIGTALAAPFRDQAVDVVAAPEARGFILGALVATELGAGLVLIRKQGSVHPGQAFEVESTVDWRGNKNVFRLRRDDIHHGQRVLLVDDWIETASQVRACLSLISQAGGVMVGVTALFQDCSEEVASEMNLTSLVRTEDLPSSD